MTLLVLGLVLFIGIHMVSSVVPLKESLVGKLGPKGYQGIYSLFALAGLGLIIYGMMEAPIVHLWAAPGWGRTVAVWLMPVALVLYAAAFLPSSVKSFTRHPLLWGTFLWAFVHLLANGDLASVLLFGGLGAFAFSKVFLIGDRQTPELGGRKPIVQDGVMIVVGLAIYGLLLYFHRFVSGVNLL